MACSRSKITQFVLFTLVISIVGYLLLGQNFAASFGPTDDHGILGYLGSDRILTLQEIPRLIQLSEIGSLGSYPRFRLLYTPFIILETYLWKDSVFLWYFAKYILFVISFTIFWWIIRKYTGIILGFLIVLFSLTFPFWGDIWSRLGPGEIYAVFGTALYAMGFTGLWSQRKQTATETLNWFYLLAGTSIAVGTKENFVILLLPIMYLMYRRIKQKQFPLLGAIVISLCTIFTFITSYFSAIAVMKNSGDVYGNSVDLSFRLRQTISHSLFLLQETWMFFGIKLIAAGIVCIGAIIYIFFRYKKIRIPYISFLQKLFIGLFLLALLVLSQIFFYSGIWPTGGRYDFPGMMAIPISIIFIYSSTILFLKHISTNRLYIQLFTLVTTVALGVWILVFRFPVVRMSRINMEESRKFMSKIQTIIRQTSPSPEIPIIIESQKPLDYEMIFSVPIYLRYYGVKNPIFLKIEFSNTDNYTGLEKKLADKLESIALNGNTYYSTFAKYPDNTSCFSLQISDQATVDCRPLVSFGY